MSFNMVKIHIYSAVHSNHHNRVLKAGEESVEVPDFEAAPWLKSDSIALLSSEVEEMEARAKAERQDRERSESEHDAKVDAVIKAATEDEVKEVLDDTSGTTPPSSTMGTKRRSKQ